MALDNAARSNGLARQHKTHFHNNLLLQNLNTGRSRFSDFSQCCVHHLANICQASAPFWVIVFAIAITGF